MKKECLLCVRNIVGDETLCEFHIEKLNAELPEDQKRQRKKKRKFIPKGTNIKGGNLI